MKFKDVEFMTAQEKKQVLSDWERFLESDFERNRFTRRLYDHLIQHCSFIAHYNRDGFYRVYFDEKRNTGRFIDQFVDGVSAEYGMEYWLHGDYEDINSTMCERMRKYAPGLKASLEESIKEEDLRTAQGLLEKHGLRFRIEESDIQGDICGRKIKVQAVLL